MATGPSVGDPTRNHAAQRLWMGEREPNVPDYDDDQNDGEHVVDEGGTRTHTYR